MVEKELIHSGRLRSDNEAFYRFFITSVITFDNRRLHDARVVIDGPGELIGMSVPIMTSNQLLSRISGIPSLSRVETGLRDEDIYDSG